MATETAVPRVRGPLERARALAAGRQDWSTWPRYESAALGFREYWYPVAWARQIAGEPTRLTLGGERLLLARDAAGTVSALRADADGGYPTAERIGLVWVYLGDAEPPPVELDIPA